ncbi:UV-endonuclease UvdE [Lachnospiraceae bacterium KM106-2]|nr:UV-endonuclease UvdE [Lachnospiraceae bacterium KM106-2]
MAINLGYCCVTMLHPEIRCNRASTKTYLEKMDYEKRKPYLLDKARENVLDLARLLYANEREDIYAYRLSEQLLPQIDLDYYKVSDVKEELKKVGEIANQFQMQLSTHPSQYFVLNSKKEDVVERTIHSLNLFADMFEVMELDKIPNITLHLGMKGGYDTVEEAIDVFCKNFGRFQENTKSYLVLENDHVSFTVDECLKVHEKIGIPIVFDNKHYEWNPGIYSYEDCVKKVIPTWGDRYPKFHLSSDKEGKKHAHSDYVAVEDYEKMEEAIMKTTIRDCYVMLECKRKDEALLRLRKDCQKRRKELF